MTLSLVTTDRKAPTATSILNHPEKRNALNAEMFDAPDNSLDTFKTRNDIIILQITGRGRAFCTGFHLAAVAHSHHQERTHYSLSTFSASSKGISETLFR